MHLLSGWTGPAEPLAGEPEVQTATLCADVLKFHCRACFKFFHCLRITAIVTGIVTGIVMF